MSTQNTSTMSEQERLAYNQSRTGLFKGTIAVCVIYGVFALSLIVAMVVSSSARAMLGDEMGVFTATLIVGSLIVMAMLVWNMMSYKVTVKKTINNLTCPDYWELQQISAPQQALLKSENKAYMKYKCVPSSKVFHSTSWAAPTNPDSGSKLDKYATKLAGARATGETAIALSCRELYPDLMALSDVDANRKSTNDMRCDYLNKCGSKFSWSSVCPGGA